MLRSKKTKLQNAHSPAQLKAQGGETKRTEEKKGKEVKAKDRKKVTAISLFLLEKKKKHSEMYNTDEARLPHNFFFL